MSSGAPPPPPPHLTENYQKLLALNKAENDNQGKQNIQNQSPAYQIQTSPSSSPFQLPNDNNKLSHNTGGNYRFQPYSSQQGTYISCIKNFFKYKKK